jgi:hypothetical protein
MYRQIEIALKLKHDWDMFGRAILRNTPRLKMDKEK